MLSKQTVPSVTYNVYNTHNNCKTEKIVITKEDFPNEILNLKKNFWIYMETKCITVTLEENVVCSAVSGGR